MTLCEDILNEDLFLGHMNKSIKKKKKNRRDSRKQEKGTSTIYKI